MQKSQLHFSSVYFWQQCIDWLLTVRVRVSEKLIAPHLVKKFLAFYGTRLFFTSFTGARHLSQVDPVHSFPSCILKIHLILFPFTLKLPNGLLPFCPPPTKFYTSLLAPICATFPAHPIRLVGILRLVIINITVSLPLAPARSRS